MDTSDENITFDEKGVCDHCNGFYRDLLPHWDTGEKGRQQIAAIFEKIKADNKGKPFDCIMGMSGGLDSSYLLHIAVKEFGLRPLVFHVDGGWNSQLAVHNIEVIVEKLGLDLYTEVINWEEMKDFQRAFFKASVPHIDIPQDHAFIATLYKFANKHGIKYILNGGNYSTECVRNPLEWMYYGTDMWQLKDIHNQFGDRPLKDYPLSSIWFHKVYLRFIKGVKVVKPLNYVPYIREDAIKTLTEEYGWKSYPRKHDESRFTKFYEGYWLPKKFGYDTRKIQYSSLILTKQMTRDDALSKLALPAHDPETIDQDFEYVANKLDMTVDELQRLMELPNKSYRDYKSQRYLFDLGAKVMHFLGMERAIKR
jgi:N-acetyl sugar amidotransferase